jgi:general nucleoside transport system ATP-binding protein
MDASSPTRPIVEMQAITKRFGPVTANQAIDFDLAFEEIHGLLGENGAGKSTLMKILYGIYQPDSGHILIDGRQQVIDSPRTAITLGIGMVHQHFMQVPKLSVIDNIILGLKPASPLWLDRDSARQRILDLARDYGLQVDPDASIWQLSVGERQRVEILKALYREVKILILDEPTSVLTPQETDELFATLRACTLRGMSVIFISHRLEEALAITDRCTVLRDGHVVATPHTANTNKNELARLMVGRDVLFRLSREGDDLEPGAEVLRVEQLEVIGDRGVPAVSGVSFTVRRGEIVGIAGVDGNGQSELVQALMGLRRNSGGRVYVDGADIAHESTRDILQRGVAYIPEDLDDALIANFNLIDNVALDRHYTPELSRRGVLARDRMTALAREVIDTYDVRAAGEYVTASTLSGGNKQKLIIGRELSRDTHLLIAAQPTRGVDIGAEEYIRNLLLGMRHKGQAILLVSSKLDEILSLCDRILVMEGGHIRGELAHDEADVEHIGLLMAGTSK